LTEELFCFFIFHPWWSFGNEDVRGAFYFETRRNVKIICKKGEILTFSESNRREVRPEKSETVGLGDTRISKNDERVTKDGASGIRHLVNKSDFVIRISPGAP
jgi:hypothetical protein